MAGYESVFEKKSFGGELEHGDIEAFFRECDLYPSQAEVEEAMDVTMRGKFITFSALYSVTISCWIFIILFLKLSIYDAVYRASLVVTEGIKYT